MVIILEYVSLVMARDYFLANHESVSKLRYTDGPFG